MLTRPALASALLVLLLAAGCTANKQFQRASALQRSGKPAEALAIFEKLTTRTTSRKALSQLYVRIGECDWSLDHQNEALQSFLKAAELDSSNTSAQLHLAQTFLAGGAPDKAMIFGDIVLARDPNNLDAMTAVAQAYAFQGDIAAATRRFEEILLRDPGRADAVVTLAQIYSARGRTDAARRILENAAVKSPNNAEIQIALARFEEEQGNSKEAEGAYRKAVSLQDDAATNLRLAQFLERSARIPEAEAVLHKVDDLRPAKPYALADFQMISGRDGVASLQYLDLLLQHEDKSHDKTAATLAARAIEAKLAVATQQTGSKREQSLLEARAALGTNRPELGPEMSAILAAEIELVEGDANTAAALAHNVLEAHSDSVPAHYVLGLALSRLDKNAEAHAEWQSALDADPDFVPARLSSAELTLQEGSAKEAEQLIVPVVRQEPANLQALDLFARVLVAENDYPAATSIAMRYEAIDKTSPRPHIVLGNAALAQHRLAYALIEFEQAIVLDPKSAEAMDGLVRVYRMGTITRPMLQHMEKTAATPPTSASLMELAGRLNAEHGWNDAAARCFTAALRIEPNRTSAATQLAALQSRTGNEVAASDAAAGISKANALLINGLHADDASNPAAAIQSYEAALKKGDSTGVAANNLAWIYAQQGRNLDRALELAQRAREANPANPAVTDTLGYVFLRRHEYSLAMATLKRADELLHTQNSEDTELAEIIRRHLAEATRDSGQ